MSQELSRTGSRILRALSPLDDFIQNPQPRVRTETYPETSRNSSRENQRTNEDGCENDLHPEVQGSLSHVLMKQAPMRHPHGDRCSKRNLLIAPLGLLEENRTRRGLQVSPDSAMETAVRQRE